MNVKVDHDDMSSTGFITTLDGLDKLCSILLYQHNGRQKDFLRSVSLSINLQIDSVLFDNAKDVSHACHFERMKELLEPLRNLHSVSSVRVETSKEYEMDSKTLDSDQENSYKTELIASISRIPHSFDATMRGFVALRDRCYQALNNHQYLNAAVENFRSLVILRDFNILTDQNTIVIGSEFAGMTRERALVKMHLQARSNAAAVYLVLKDYEQAYDYAQLAWSPEEVRFCGENSNSAYAYQMGALASEKLGEGARAIQEMGRACRLQPYNTGFQAEYQRLVDDSMEGAMASLASLHMGLIFGREDAGKGSLNTEEG